MSMLKNLIKFLDIWDIYLLLYCRPPGADCSKDDLTCNPVMSLLRRDACSLSYMEVIQPTNWPIVQSEINYQISRGQSGTESVRRVFSFDRHSIKNKSENRQI